MNFDTTYYENYQKKIYIYIYMKIIIQSNNILNVDYYSPGNKY